MRTRRSRGARRKAAKSRQAAAAAFARRIGASLSRPGRALLRLRPRKRGRGKATARSRRSFTLRSWSFALKASALVGSLGAIGLALALAYTLVVMPIPQRGIRDGKQSGIEILASDGSLISGHSQPQRYVPLASLPTHLIDAVLATEDRRFYAHWGVDPWGLARATAANVMAMRLSQGGSTITQQLAKNLFLEPRRTLGRKIEEMLYALALEVRYSKQEILELYFNNVYFGGGAYGIAAATRTYFDCEPEDLALAQSALIAGLLKAPSRYAPTNSITLAMERSRVVLEGMADAEAVPLLASVLARVAGPQVALVDSAEAVAEALVRAGAVGRRRSRVLVALITLAGTHVDLHDAEEEQEHVQQEVLRLEAKRHHLSEEVEDLKASVAGLRQEQRDLQASMTHMETEAATYQSRLDVLAAFESFLQGHVQVIDASGELFDQVRELARKGASPGGRDSVALAADLHEKILQVLAQHYANAGRAA